MSKHQLSKHQQRQLNLNHQRRLRYSDKKSESGCLSGNEQEGIVISRFGQHAQVESAEGVLYHCNIRRTISSLVTGDRVVWRAANSPQEAVQLKGIIEAVHKRTSILARPDVDGRTKLIAANINQIVIVVAMLPATSLNIVDHYLVAGESLNIEPMIVLNKIDLFAAQERKAIDNIMDIYRQIPYRVFEVSSQTSEGMHAFEQALSERVSIFVGQSGVGKSSLLNVLLAPSEQYTQTGALSDHSGLGQHTTTSTRLYHFQKGGDVIDSPGIREFGLWHLTPEQITHGFIEFRHYSGKCKFRDCTHSNDPGCAIREAVACGQIAAERWQNYHGIMESIKHKIKEIPSIQR